MDTTDNLHFLATGCNNGNPAQKLQSENESTQAQAKPKPKVPPKIRPKPKKTPLAISSPGEEAPQAVSVQDSQVLQHSPTQTITSEDREAKGETTKETTHEVSTKCNSSPENTISHKGTAAAAAEDGKPKGDTIEPMPGEDSLQYITSPAQTIPDKKSAAPFTSGDGVVGCSGSDISEGTSEAGAPSKTSALEGTPEDVVDIITLLSPRQDINETATSVGLVMSSEKDLRTELNPTEDSMNSVASVSSMGTLDKVTMKQELTKDVDTVSVVTLDPSQGCSGGGADASHATSKVDVQLYKDIMLKASNIGQVGISKDDIEAVIGQPAYDHSTVETNDSNGDENMAAKASEMPTTNEEEAPKDSSESCSNTLDKLKEESHAEDNEKDDIDVTESEPNVTDPEAEQSTADTQTGLPSVPEPKFKSETTTDNEMDSQVKQSKELESEIEGTGLERKEENRKESDPNHEEKAAPSVNQEEENTSAHTAPQADMDSETKQRDVIVDVQEDTAPETAEAEQQSKLLCTRNTSEKPLVNTSESGGTMDSQKDQNTETATIEADAPSNSHADLMRTPESYEISPTQEDPILDNRNIEKKEQWRHIDLTVRFYFLFIQIYNYVTIFANSFPSAKSSRRDQSSYI